jgi:hypothetical protein
MILNGFPAHVVAAIHNLTKLGIARVEVNGKRGEEFTQKSGVGQGDPLSAFRFNIGTEPLLRALRKHTAQHTYRDVAGTSIDPSAYADDHLHILGTQTPLPFCIILDTYHRYTVVSGLRINAAKTELLTINTPQALVQDIETRTGITPVDSLTLLGVRFTNTYHGSRQATFAHIDTKAIASQIRISSKYAHMLHRRLIIQAALAPMYAHAFMAFGSTPEVNKQIAELIKKGMWTQVQGPDTKQIRIQVAFQRVFAGYDMGGLNISHPQQVNEGLMLNTLERLVHKHGEYTQNMEHAPNIIRILHGLLDYTNCTSIQHALRFGGVQVWRSMAARIAAHNAYLGGCMFAMARFCAKMENRQSTWHTAPLWGHTCNNPIMPITEQDELALRRMGVHTVGQIFDTGDGITVHSHSALRACPIGLSPAIWNKVTQVRQAMVRKQILRNGTHISENTQQIIRRKGTYSHVNRMIYKEALATEIKAPPSYFTRRQDRMPLPSVDEYCKAYDRLMTCTFTSTIATAFNFAALNRTVWTAQKQSLSGNAGGGRQAEPIDMGECDLCGAPENTAHILADCNGYSYRLWERFNIHLTAACRMNNPDNPQILVTFHNIMYFKPLTSLPREHAPRILALFIELKRDIYVRRTERCIQRDQGVGGRRGRIYTDQRIDMHISIACNRIIQVLALKGKHGGILGILREICLGM